MIRWIRRLWRQRLRNLDHQALFPGMEAAATSRQHFLNAARLHLLLDDAWNVDRDELNERDRRLWDEVFGQAG
jgi:hypothetical protein